MKMVRKGSCEGTGDAYYYAQFGDLGGDIPMVLYVKCEILT